MEKKFEQGQQNLAAQSPRTLGRGCAALGPIPLNLPTTLPPSVRPPTRPNCAPLSHFGIHLEPVSKVQEIYADISMHSVLCNGLCQHRRGYR